MPNSPLLSFFASTACRGEASSEFEASAIAFVKSEVRAGARALGGAAEDGDDHPGASSDVITANIAKDYEHNKYTFHGYLMSSSIARIVCEAAKTMLVDGLKKTAAIMSEDAAWTGPPRRQLSRMPAEGRRRQRSAAGTGGAKRSSSTL